MKQLLFVLLLSLFAFAAPDNFTNWNDYTDFTAFKADSLKYGTPVAVTGATLNSMVAMANDTGAAGYASDSISFTYGYRLGTIVLNSASKADTSWSNRVIVGTFLLDSAHIITSGTTSTTDSTNGSAIPAPNLIDTSNVTGYAVSTAPVSLLTAQLIQPWIKGATGNRIGSFVRARLLFLQYLFVPTRVK